jgi:hypothetical protein
MMRVAPRVAVWCLTHLVYGERGSAILGDLLERFEQGESRSWFWRQTLATVAYGFRQAVRDHGAPFAGAVVLTVVLYFAGEAGNSWISRHLIHFQTHRLLEIDPHWNRRLSWGIAFLMLDLFRTTLCAGVSGWLIARLHRAYPRAIVLVGALVILTLRLPQTLRIAEGLLTHSRFLEYLVWNLIHQFLVTGTFVVCGLWGSRSARPAVRAR